jgi:hypothetical protein
VTIQEGKPQLRRPPRGGFLISVLNTGASVDLVETLKNIGFNAGNYKERFVPNKDKLSVLEKHEAIWIGYRVPPNEAIEAIKIAVRKWPHLKYLHISSDDRDPPDYVNDQMFIGGASSAAKELGLKAWDPQEIENLDEGLSPDEFHSAIRSKYSKR